MVVSVVRCVMSSLYSFLPSISGRTGVQPPEFGADGGMKADAL
jgi:hypothetical protein